MMKREQISAMNIQYQYFPFTQFLEDTLQCGICNIELWGAAPHCYPEDMTAQDIRRLRREIESRGLRLVCYTPEQCIYPVNIAADSAQERFRSIRYFEQGIRTAAELGTDKMLVTSGWGYFDGGNRSEAWKYAAEALRQLAEFAEGYQIRLALEVLREDESNLVNDLSSLTEMMEQAGHANLYAVLDTIPMALAGEAPEDYLKALGERLIHVHFIDGAPRGHLAWGDGVLDAAGYLKQMGQYGYQGYLSLEITDGRYKMNPGESIQKSMAFLSGLLEE